VIGNVDGVLAIFKGDKATKPWKKCSELGTVSVPHQIRHFINLIVASFSSHAISPAVTCINVAHSSLACIEGLRII
jgi:hypothetical protein